MPFPESQHSTHMTPLAEEDGPPLTPCSDNGNTRCPYESSVVQNPTTARILLMFLRDFVNQKSVFGELSDFHCPMMKCYERFTEPMELIRHLLSCPWLPAGEFECQKCDNWHRFPTNEKDWSEWSGWKENRLRQKRSLSSKMKDALMSVRGSSRRGGSGSSSSSSSSSSCSSSSSGSCRAGEKHYPHSYSCGWKHASPSTLSDLIDAHAPSPTLDPEAGKAGVFNSPYRAAPEALPHHSISEAPNTEVAAELPPHARPYELQGTGVSLQQYAPQSLQGLQGLQGLQNPQSLPTPWNSFTSTAANSSQGSMSSISATGKEDDRANLPSYNYLVSLQSSIENQRVPMAQNQSLNSAQILNMDIVESPTDMGDSPAGRTLWPQPVNHSDQSIPDWDFSRHQTQMHPAHQMPSQSIQTSATMNHGHSDSVISGWTLEDQPMATPWDQHPHPQPHPHSQPVFNLQESFGENPKPLVDPHGRYTGMAGQHHGQEEQSRHFHRQSNHPDSQGHQPLAAAQEPESEPSWIANQAFAGIQQQAPTLAGLADDTAFVSPPALEPEAAPGGETKKPEPWCSDCPWEPSGIKSKFAAYRRKHLDTHKDHRFPCGYPGCPKVYTRADNRAKHRRATHPVDNDVGGAWRQ